MTIQKGKWVHTLEIPLRWHDMDAFGHVNNSLFFTYLEETRVTWLDKINPDLMTSAETGPVVITASCTFLKPIVYPETIIVKLFVGSPGRSSYECFYEIRSKNDSTILYAEGTTKVVWIDRKLGGSVPLPDYIRNHLPENNA